MTTTFTAKPVKMTKSASRFFGGSMFSTCLSEGFGMFSNYLKNGGRSSDPDQVKRMEE